MKYYVIIIKPTRYTKFSNLFFFWNKTLHVSDSSSVHHQESQRNTQQWYMSYSFAVSKPVWHMLLLCIHWKTPDDGQKNSLKHVNFYSKKRGDYQKKLWNGAHQEEENEVELILPGRKGLEDWWEKRDWWKKTGMTEETGGRR